MASQTVTTYADVMKEVWTQDRLEKQFFENRPFFDSIERTSRPMIGKQAMVPLHKGRAGGHSIMSSAGGALNAADYQRVDNALYTLSYPWKRVSLEFATLNQATGGAASVGQALNVEVEGAVNDLKADSARQYVGNQDALIAECTTTSSSTTVNLVSTGYGYDAIVRGWLYPGLMVDIGTTANEVSVAADRTITSVSESSTDPEIVISGAAVTTAAGDYVSIANARAATTSNETNGLRQIAGSTTSAVGGLDPDNAGEGFWKPAHVDTTSTILTTNLLLTMQSKIFQKTFRNDPTVLLGAKQRQALYELLQNQVRFSEDKVKAGSLSSIQWNDMEIMCDPNIPDREAYMLTKDDFMIVTGKYSKPTWASDVQGTNTGLQYNLGNTDFQDAITYPHQLAIKRRNGTAAAIGLTA